MSTSKLSVAILEDFCKRVREARLSNQKLITIPIHEADNIVHNLNIVILKLLDKHQTQESKKNDQDDVIIVSMDGGTFDEKR